MSRLFVMLCLLLSGCSVGSGEGLDASGRPIGEAPDPGDEPTLANIQARIFTPICTQCHVGASAPQGLRLDTANSFADTVGVASREVSGLNRVEPFDPDRSYLFQKINGTAAVGARMPLGGPPLSADEIALVRQWISDGAMPTPTSARSGVSKVTATSIRRSGNTVFIHVTVSAELDSSSLLPSSFVLVSSHDRIFANSDDHQLDNFLVKPASGNPYAFIVQWSGSAADGDNLLLSLSASTSTRLLDLSGRAVQAHEIRILAGDE